MKCLLIKILLIIGAINWGLIGAFEFNLVQSLAGQFPIIVRAIYILFGISGVLSLASFAKGASCKSCSV